METTILLTDGEYSVTIVEENRNSSFRHARLLTCLYAGTPLLMQRIELDTRTLHRYDYFVTRAAQSLLLRTKALTASS